MQKLMQICPNHHRLIMEKIKGQLLSISIDKNGCRVAQKAFQFFPVDLKEQLLQDLINHGQVDFCAFNVNGNHVIQKIFTTIKGNESPVYKALINTIEANLASYCLNEFCCRILQRMLENCSSNFIKDIALKVLDIFHYLIESEFGTFVLCSTLDNAS